MANPLAIPLLCNRMVRLLLSLSLIAAIRSQNIFFGPSSSGGSQEPSVPAYRSTVSEVRLLFFATDEHNRPVEELRQDDFAVIDDEKVIRHFRSLTSAAFVNLDVIVLIDSSDSVLPRFQQEIASVLQLISQWPWSPGDSVSVLSVSGMDAHFVCDGNCQTVFTADQMASVPRGGATPLFDALKLAATLLLQRQQPNVWPLIILFSDGQDTSSGVSFHDALQNMLASGAQIYAIDASDSSQPSNGSATLHRLADDSGGRYLRIGEGAVAILNHVIEDVHTARVVTYALPQSRSEFHSIRILPTHNLNLQFRSRRGYYHYSNSGY